MKRFLLLAVAFAFAAFVAVQARATTPSDGDIAKRIRRYQRQTWHWQRVMGKPLTRIDRRVAADRRELLRLWRQRAAIVWKQARRPPHKAAWLCIHRYEGPWNDPNPPYWGGLQMDMNFQRAYGPYLLRLKGTADHWTPLEQMWTAERAYRDRGFAPWPNTARMCPGIR